MTPIGASGILDSAGALGDVILPLGGAVGLVVFVVRVVLAVQERTLAAHQQADEVAAEAVRRAQHDLEEFRRLAREEQVELRALIRGLEEQLSSQQREIADFHEQRAQWVIERARMESRIEQLERIVQGQVQKGDAPGG